MQVRKIEKDDESQFMRWDLTNDHNRKIASGIYAGYIHIPELNRSKNLKMVVIQKE